MKDFVFNSTVDYAPIRVKRGEGIYVYRMFACMCKDYSETDTDTHSSNIAKSLG